LEINPNNMKILSNKGVALARLGKHEEAAASFDKALEINPNEFDILSNKNLVLAKLNQKKIHILLETEGNYF
jgi:Flp pilus assembly protein TadD